MESVDIAESWQAIQIWTVEVLPRILTAALILVLGWMASSWAGRALRRGMTRTGRFDRTIIPVISASVRYAGLIVVIVAALGQLGVPTTSVLAVLGAAGLAIGLALQGTLSNIAAGIMLLWLRPFRVGDYIDAQGIAGTVREIGLFATELDTFDGIYRFVPNSEIWNKPIFNYSRNPTRMTDLEVGISYGSDIEKARQIMLDLAAEHDDVAGHPEPIAFVDALGDSAVVMRFRVWIRIDTYWGTMRELLEETKRRLDAAGIEIPFPQRVLHVMSDDGTGEDAAPAEMRRPSGILPESAAANIPDSSDDD